MQPPQTELPVHDPIAERSILGAMLRDNGCIDDLAVSLGEDSFYVAAHRMIFAAIVDMRNHPKQKIIDLVTLADELKKRKQIADVGGYAYLMRLLDNSPTSANAAHYAEIVHEKAFWRGLSHFGAEVMHHAARREGTPEEIGADLESRMFALCEKGMDVQTHTVGDTLIDAMDAIDRRWRNGKPVTGISTGLIDLDELTAGLHNGELVIIGARPSVGKTALAIHLAVQAAKAADTQVLFFSLEQSREALATRILCAESRVDSHRVRTGQLRGDDHKHLIEANGRLAKVKLRIDDTGSGQTMLRIAATARREKRSNGVRLIVVDYLQLIEPEDRKAQRYEQVGAAARRLKFLAKEIGCPVVCVAMVGRQAEGRDRPRLSDLRESGDIEAHADAVYLLDKGRDESGKEIDGRIDCIVAKNRDGQTGEVSFAFLKNCLRFENYASGSQSAWTGALEFPK